MEVGRIEPHATQALQWGGREGIPVLEVVLDPVSEERQVAARICVATPARSIQCNRVVMSSSVESACIPRAIAVLLAGDGLTHVKTITMGRPLKRTASTRSLSQPVIEASPPQGDHRR